MADGTSRQASNGNSTGAHPVSGDAGWPTVEDLSKAQTEIEDNSIRWLSHCQELASRRVPRPCFEAVPSDIWRFKVTGSKVVVMRTPQLEQLGSIVLPTTSQKPNEVGWILTVGPNIHRTDEANVRGREYGYHHFGDFSPLLAVGDLVLFNRHAGQALVSSLIDEGMVHRSKAQQFVLISIADVFGPLVQVKRSDWDAVQSEIYVPTNEERLIV